MEKNANKTSMIDIDKILRDRNPKLHKKLPRFVINYIKKIIHEKEVNDFLEKNNDNYGIDWLEEAFANWQISSEASGIENLDKEGRYIYAANHPVGSWDGDVIIAELYKFHGHIKAVVNDLLLNMKNLEDLFLGVNKHGTTPREAVKLLDETFASDMPILYFPAGLVSRRKKKVIKDLEWKKTFVTRAVKYKRDIVPIHISGKLSNFFYNIAGLRKFFGIKANIEMLYLVDEVFKQKGTNYIIKFGKPIPYQTFDKRFSHIEWAQKLKEHTYKIKDNIDTKFDVF